MIICGPILGAYRFYLEHLDRGCFLALILLPSFIFCYKTSVALSKISVGKLT